MKISSSLCLLLLAARLVAASPYAGEEKRSIKALAENEVAGLAAGRALGLARAAELNSHPGPMHVLELGDELHLTAAQRESLSGIFATMHDAAVRLGAEIIERETQLDGLFARRAATPETVAALTDTIAGLQGRLRAAHLNAHVATARILTAEQIAQYDRLRGYAHD